MADSNGKEDLKAHYNELIDKGLDAKKVELVVTDMLPAYKEVITEMFPNARHQYCIFHFIQHINKLFKAALKAHRYSTFKIGERRAAHQISLLMLKGQEKLTEAERSTVFTFCETYPNMGSGYALKEDIRTLYANAECLEQAYAYKDMIEAEYNYIVCNEMQKALVFVKNNFEPTVAYLHKGYFLDKTNNDAERMMRAIKRTQQTHYFLRKEEYYIKKIKVVLGIQNPIAN